MADVKQYITHAQEGGSVMISEDVVSTIVENTLTEIDGVVKGGSEVIGKKSWGKGIRIRIEDNDTLTIGCNIIVRYGVTGAVESVTGVKVNDVDVNVCGIARK